MNAALNSVGRKKLLSEKEKCVCYTARKVTHIIMNKTFWIVLAIIAVAGVALYVFADKAPEASPGAGGTVLEGAEGGSATETGLAGPKTVTVSYANGQFFPKTVTVSVGDTVEFVAGEGVTRMWVGADEHPAHAGYDGTTRSEHCAAEYTGSASFDQCKSSLTYSFTFTKAGTWDYHDHVNASAQGTVVVE